MKKVLLGILLLVGFSIGSTVQAGKLIINADQSDPAPRKVFTEFAAEFDKANPDITVEFNVYDKESYKTSIRNWLSSNAPDLVFWYAGERMRTFVEKGLLEDVSDVWRDNNLSADFASTKPSITFSGKQYAVPYTYYQWGVYYNKAIFDAHQLKEPKNWNEFLKLGQTLNSKGITPIAIGTKYLWTAAGWFDYLNLRVNGLDFHMDLMAGKIPYDDARVKRTFTYWEELINNDFFLKNHSSYSWQEAQPFMYQGKAAMYLIGNFITPNFPKEGSFGYFRFPTINPGIPWAEDAPTDLVAIPSRAKNKAEAKRFLAFLARPENQTKINEALLQIPTNARSKAKDDVFLNKGIEVLKASSTAQFYDRDTNPEMAKIGMKGFQEFMVHPERLDKILKRLEKARQRIFRKK
jgi:multiple sugar transport system substrate-binding protein